MNGAILFLINSERFKLINCGSMLLGAPGRGVVKAVEEAELDPAAMAGEMNASTLTVLRSRSRSALWSFSFSSSKLNLRFSSASFAAAARSSRSFAVSPAPDAPLEEAASAGKFATSIAAPFGPMIMYMPSGVCNERDRGK